ncbi:MAG: MHFG family PEP-CTERM protein, partial [Pseudomonadota bacterium]|nr:MHFG family PEP-CTERM protein [Pseudomonadota bacterium]
FAPLLRLLLVALSIAALLPASAAAGINATHPPASPTLDTCSWDRPGRAPFMGDVVAAVDRYQDIPVDVRERLKSRMARHAYDDVVSIRRDSITGRAKPRYGSTIRDMHFGSDKLCHSVSRTAWSKDTQERGLVYCDSGQCILVPTVCRNVSRIARAEVAHEHAEGDEAEPAALSIALANLNAPIPLETLAAPLLPDTESGVGSPPQDDRHGKDFGGGFATGGGEVGSFTAGSIPALAVAAITASSEGAAALGSFRRRPRRLRLSPPSHPCANPRPGACWWADSSPSPLGAVVEFDPAAAVFAPLALSCVYRLPRASPGSRRRPMASTRASRQRYSMTVPRM